MGMKGQKYPFRTYLKKCGGGPDLTVGPNPELLGLLEPELLKKSSPTPETDVPG